MSLIGSKNNKNLYNNLLKDLIPDNLNLYIEPFGGEFGLYKLIEIKPKLAIYNDININMYNNILNKYSNVKYYNKDYKEIFLEFDSNDSFFYVDPPYYKKENKYENHNFLKESDHIELSNILKKLKGKFLLSYQDRPFIRELYNEYNFYKYLGNNIILKPEIAITNYV